MTDTLAYVSFDGKHLARLTQHRDPALGPWLPLIEKESPEAIRLEWLRAELAIMKEALRLTWRKTEDTPPVGMQVIGLYEGLRGQWVASLMQYVHNEEGNLAWAELDGRIVLDGKPLWWMPIPCLPPHPEYHELPF